MPGRASGLARAGKVVKSPLVPLVLFARVARRVVARPRLAGPFLWAAPVLLLFFAAWAAGEAAGAIFGPGRETGAESAVPSGARA
jgi:hypothetical protein